MVPAVRKRPEDRDEEIVATVVHLLETEGYEAVQVRRIAAEASISLTTLYKLYGSRDELIIRAMERWMRENAYAGLASLPTADTAYDALSAIVRSVFGRWQRQPHMLVAFIRARMSTGGGRLDRQGFDIVNPAALPALDHLEPALLEDVVMILQHINIAVIERFAAGEIAVTEIVPIYERTLRRLLPNGPSGPATAGDRLHHRSSKAGRVSDSTKGPG
jgi:TetR/AcrR family transcriptional regulator, cholesterol catabolism regulator